MKHLICSIVFALYGTHHGITHSMNSITIETLPPASWGMFKALRLQAAEEFPHVFPPLAEEAAKFDQAWIQRLTDAEVPLQDKDKSEWLYFLMNDKKPIGMAGAIREYAGFANWNHLVTIVSVFIQPPYRKKGLGTILINHLLEQLKASGTVNAATLWVDPKEHAVPLYTKAGFTVVGCLDRAVKLHDGTFRSNLIMQRAIGD